MTLPEKLEKFYLELTSRKIVYSLVNISDCMALKNLTLISKIGILFKHPKAPSIKNFESQGPIFLLCESKNNQDWTESFSTCSIGNYLYHYKLRKRNGSDSHDCYCECSKLIDLSSSICASMKQLSKETMDNSN